MTLRALVALVLVCGCGSCGGAQEGAESDDIPEVVAALATDAEVIRFTGWSAEGLELYRVSWAVPDHSSSRVVAVDGEGALLEGPELMRRFGELAPDELAVRAFAVLLQTQGAEPLTPADRESIQFGTDEEWAVVEPARREEGALVFFALQGEMAPELVEHRMDLESFAIATRPVADVVVANGDRVPVGDPRCVAHGYCGCWRGCVRVQTVRGPEGEAHRILDGEAAGIELHHRESCYEGTCFQVCVADTPEARCDPGIYEANEPCTGACAPSEAPYHCETLVDGCRQVDHPNRSASSLNEERTQERP